MTNVLAVPAQSDDMIKNREGFLVSETHRQCTACGDIFERYGKVMTYCKPCNTARVKSNQSPEQKMLQRARNRARKNGVECTINLEDIHIPKICPVLQFELVPHSGSSGGRPNSPALDRIDNSKGYVPGNVQVISHRANQMKADANLAELKLFAKWVNTL